MAKKPKPPATATGTIPSATAEARGGKLRSMDVGEFIRRIKADDSSSDKRYAFFLGAGCSVSSNIPAASELVNNHWLPRLRDLHAPHETDHQAWAVEHYEGYTPANAAHYYGEVLDALFVTPDDRQREIESLCDTRTPGFGYAVLAQLIARASGRFNVVLTTNFDDLVADALYLYTNARPLVIHHESLAAFIRPTRMRPLVVKLHGDHRLAPRNTALETADLEEKIAHHTAMVLNDRGLIVMGYGGNDESIHKLLRNLPPEAIPSGAYWVHPEEPTGETLQWLLQRGGVWVKSGWFDEVMLLARNAFDLPHPQADRFTKIFGDYQAAFQKLSDNIQAKSTTDKATETLKAAVKETERSFPDFWKAVSEASRLHTSDPDGAENIYLDAIKQFPDAAPLLGNYALFLEHSPGRSDRAEALYLKAIAADPKAANVLSNYAVFVGRQPDRKAECEALYKRAIEADPRFVLGVRNYAIFLEGIPDRRAEADAYHRRAIDADPKDPTTLRNYAVYLENTAGRRADAEAFYKRAIESDPQHVVALGSYAVFLENTEGRRGEAEPFYARAIAADPEHGLNLANYALYLEMTEGRGDEAEMFYTRAVAADPKNPVTLGNYADYLHRRDGRHDEAETFYKRALDADPNRLYVLGRYADFLETIRGDKAQADALRKRTVEIKAAQGS